MPNIQNHLDQPITFDSFFGPLTLQPGLNSIDNDKLWKNAKTSNPDLEAMLRQGLIEELTA